MKNTQQLSILACQIEIPETTTAAQRDAHLKHSAEKVGDALKQQAADLVVLPELSSIDYSREAFAKLDTLAEPLNGPSFQIWRDIAITHNTTVLYGLSA